MDSAVNGASPTVDAGKPGIREAPNVVADLTDLLQGLGPSEYDTPAATPRDVPAKDWSDTVERFKWTSTVPLGLFDETTTQARKADIDAILRNTRGLVVPTDDDLFKGTRSPMRLTTDSVPFCTWSDMPGAAQPPQPHERPLVPEEGGRRRERMRVEGVER